MQGGQGGGRRGGCVPEVCDGRIERGAGGRRTSDAQLGNEGTEGDARIVHEHVGERVAPLAIVRADAVARELLRLQMVPYLGQGTLTLVVGLDQPTLVVNEQLEVVVVGRR